MAERVSINSLRPGLRLAAGLFSRDGVRLLPAGAVLTDGVYRALLASGEKSFLWARDLVDLAAVLKLERGLPPAAGQTATSDMLTVGGLVALGRGQVAEEHHADAYALGAFARQSQGVVTPKTLDLAATSTSKSSEIGGWTIPRARQTMLSVGEQLTVAAAQVWDAISRGLPKPGEELEVAASMDPNWPESAALAALRKRRVQDIRRILAALVAGISTRLDGPEGPLAIVDELIDLCAKHPFRFAELALGTPRDGEYLPDHHWTTCAISVGMAVRLKWPRVWCRRAGLAGLLADMGMAVVPPELRFSTDPLSDAEVEVMRKHVVHSVVMLGAIVGLDDEVSLAVYQHHEREDATGYPTGAAARVIHPLAKLLAVADSYSAATAARPHRPPTEYQPPKLPYDVMQQMISMTSEGKLERKYLRALVDLFGLFPVGSTVTLSDGGIARVVGADPVMVDRPIIRRLDNSTGEPAGEPIALAKLEAAELFVLEAVAAPSITGPTISGEESRNAA